MGPESLDLAIKTCEEAKADQMARLEATIKRRRDHLHKYNSIHKCLAILVDENLIKFAVLGSAVVHKVVHHVAHGKFEYDVDLDVALKRVQDLIDGDEQLNEVNIQEGSKGLSKLLHESKDYFDEQGVSVERAVDKYINGESIRITNTMEAGATRRDHQQYGPARSYVVAGAGLSYCVKGAAQTLVGR